VYGVKNIIVELQKHRGKFNITALSGLRVFSVTVGLKNKETNRPT